MLEVENITRIIENDDLSSRKRLDILFDALYPEIKKIANVQLYKSKPDSELSPTVLVNECFLKLNGIPLNTVKDRRHFFNLVSRCMRYYLVDVYRNENRHKNAGHLTQFTESFGQDDPIKIDLLDVHDALINLESIDKGLAELVELRFFADLSFSEISALYETSKSKVYQKWLLAKSILLNFIEHD